jgi:hypothetical protein
MFDDVWGNDEGEDQDDHRNGFAMQRKEKERKDKKIADTAISYAYRNNPS